MGTQISSFAPVTQQAEYTCGTIALLHAWAFPEDSLRTISPGSMSIFFYMIGRLILLVLDSLDGHPADLSRDRATMVLDKLGTSLVQSALRSKTPWAAIKAEASKPSFRLRLVTPLELSQHLQDREKTTFGASASSKKERGTREKKLATKPIKVDPQAGRA